LSICDSLYVLGSARSDSSPDTTIQHAFELGLSVLHTTRKPKSHTWFVFESTPFRIQKSLSDLNGTDPYIHDDTIEGVFRELAKAFVRAGRQPSVNQMRSLYNKLTSVMSRILTDAAAIDPFNARAFRDIVVFTTALAQSM
jgi:hypothetical protein